MAASSQETERESGREIEREKYNTHIIYYLWHSFFLHSVSITRRLTPFPFVINTIRFEQFFFFCPHFPDSFQWQFYRPVPKSFLEMPSDNFAIAILKKKNIHFQTGKKNKRKKMCSNFQRAAFFLVLGAI